MRHADALPADPGDSDELRPLSIDGRKAARDLATAMTGRGTAFTRIWSSPLVRAIQTAEIVANGINFREIVEAQSCLAPASSPGDVLEQLEYEPDTADLLLVGHEPMISTLVGALLGRPIGGFSPASATCISTNRPEANAGQLVWHWSSREQRFYAT